jgi:hypothetical protein
MSAWRASNATACRAARCQARSSSVGAVPVRADMTRDAHQRVILSTHLRRVRALRRRQRAQSTAHTHGTTLDLLIVSEIVRVHAHNIPSATCNCSCVTRRISSAVRCAARARSRAAVSAATCAAACVDAQVNAARGVLFTLLSAASRSSII